MQADLFSQPPSYPLAAGFKKKQDSRKLQEAECFSLVKLPKNRLRFENKISYEPMSGCWLWSGAVGISGHGQYFLKGSSSNGLLAAHRASWMIYRGELSPYSLVCHKCDVPYCVNPDHLFLGTHKDNMQDCRMKNRTIMPDAVGEFNCAAILTEKNVIEIRASSLSILELSSTYGVARSTIHAVITGVTWGHIDGARKSMPNHPTEYQTLKPELIAAIEACPLMARLQVAEKFGVSPTTVRKIRAAKKALGLIKPTGERRIGSGGGSANVWQKA